MANNLKLPEQMQGLQDALLQLRLPLLGICLLLMGCQRKSAASGDSSTTTEGPLVHTYLLEVFPEKDSLQLVQVISAPGILKAENSRINEPAAAGDYIIQLLDASGQVRRNFSMRPQFQEHVDVPKEDGTLQSELIQHPSDLFTLRDDGERARKLRIFKYQSPVDRREIQIISLPAPASLD